MKWRDLCAGAMLAATMASGAAAQDWGGVGFLHEGGLYQPPRGHQELCRERPEFCAERNTQREVSQVLRTIVLKEGGVERARPMMSRLSLNQLKSVNLAVNRMLRPRNDVGGDQWSFSTFEGDCEEYVLLKRETLASLGWPRAALRIAVVKTARGVDHAVLVVTTEFEDVVLDNLRDDVVGVGASDHTFIAAESRERLGRWVRIQTDAQIRTAEMNDAASHNHAS